MKEINEAIKKLSPDDMRELAARLQLRKKTKRDLLGAMTTATGLHGLFKSLDTNCLRVLKVVYAYPDGATFVEIQRELKLDIPVIEKATEILSRNLLVYTIKNRQMLNTKMDKAYGITEIAEHISIVEPKAITDRLHKNFLHLEMQKLNQDLEKTIKDRDVKALLKFMAESGCVVTLDAARDRLPAKSADRVLAGMISQNLVTLYQGYRPDFNSYLIMQDRISPSVAAMDDHDDARKKLQVRNRYYLLQNLLHAFDIISTFGLFLTKQQEFRKIDIRRISEAMLTLKNLNGSDLSPEESAQLSMFILNRIGCLKLNKDIAAISLSEIRNEIEQPLLLAKRVLKCASPGSFDEFFKPPFEMPDYEFSKSIIKLLNKLRTATYDYVRITMLTGTLSEADERAFAESILDLEEQNVRFGTAMNFLCITGIIDVSSGKIALSDIGRDLANSMLKTYAAEEPAAPVRNLYINPDFTLMIPAHELGSETLYHLLTHTDITKNDVIINAVISKSAIVRAQKRGMSLNRFLEALQSHSKNELPQNLDFLLREWSSQTINIKISQSILLTSSHPEFIDELLLGIAKEGIVERISQNHALVRKDYIDEIIKVGRKKDAVISLFSELEEED